MRSSKQTSPVAHSLNARERAFWYAVWVLEGASYIACALAAYAILNLLGHSPGNASIAFAAAAVVFAATHYGLWCLTRPYATTNEPIRPAIDRPSLCNVDFKLMFVSLMLIPAGKSSWLSDYTIVYAGTAAASIVAWVALIEPLKAANARDAARNADVAS